MLTYVPTVGLWWRADLLTRDGAPSRHRDVRLAAIDDELIGRVLAATRPRSGQAGSVAR